MRTYYGFDTDLQYINIEGGTQQVAIKNSSLILFTITAILDGKNLRGSIGNLSFSKQGKNTIVKSKPGKGNVK